MPQLVQHFVTVEKRQLNQLNVGRQSKEFAFVTKNGLSGGGGKISQGNI
jgi:hypothetical protein